MGWFIGSDSSGRVSIWWALQKVKEVKGQKGAIIMNRYSIQIQGIRIILERDILP